ncbi:hypothetical protein [Streptomyces sp. NPDC057280]|uniref:hypothetical protein n=1 Tax=Streptomyces sp. NPDC057280 TaxID=3346081 RepID=UPI00363C1B69
MDDIDDFDLPRPRWDHHRIAILGGSAEDELTIAGGYLDVADLAAERFFAQPNDGLPIPILYLYRHSIELTLKWLIKLAARCALRDGYQGPENLSAERVAERLSKTHNIKKLADCYNRYLQHLTSMDSENTIDLKTLESLKWLDSEDETGQAYRYSLIGRDGTPARPVQENIDFYEQANRLHRLAHLLQDGYTSHLADYEAYQRDMSWY